MAFSVGLRGVKFMKTEVDYWKFLKWCEEERINWKENNNLETIEGDFVLGERRHSIIVNINPDVIKKYEETTGEKLGYVGFIVK